jgi:hypothetical protein
MAGNKEHSYSISTQIAAYGGWLWKEKVLL